MNGASGAAAWHRRSFALRQNPKAVTIMARCVSAGAAPHRPLRLPEPVQLRRHRPGAVLQVLQVAVAVERLAVDAAGLAAPVAGLRGAWTGVVGLGPAAAAVGLVDPRAGRDADLPGPARLSGGPRGLTALSPVLPGSDQPTKQVGTVQPEPMALTTVLPGRTACRAWSGCGRRRPPEGATAGAPCRRGGLDLLWRAAQQGSA